MRAQCKHSEQAGWRDSSVVRTPRLFQRTQIQFLAPMAGDSQPPVSLTPDDLTFAFGLVCLLLANLEEFLLNQYPHCFMINTLLWQTSF